MSPLCLGTTRMDLLGHGPFVLGNKNDGSARAVYSGMGPLCSGSLFGQFARAICWGMSHLCLGNRIVLLGHRPFVLGHQDGSARAWTLCAWALGWLCSGMDPLCLGTRMALLGHATRAWTLLSCHVAGRHACSSSSPSTSSTENDLESDSESRSSQVGTSTLRSQVGTSIPQASTSFPSRDALGEIKDEAEDKFDEDIWFSADEKRNKMTKESIVELLEEFPLPPPFSARVPALQEPANYGMDLETSVYEGQIRSCYRIPMHPFVVAFFNHYKMALGQLVPNGWRKLVGLICLVQTLGYPVTIHDFMRIYLEVCFIKNVANSVGWYYIHNRVRVIKGGPKSNKGWHSRYFFIQRPSGKWEFPRKWNGFCKDYEKKGFLAPNATTKKLIDRIKMREMAGKGEGAKGDFLGLLQKASKGKRKEGTGEGSSPMGKRSRAPTPPVPPLVHLAHGVLPSDKLILENQPHEAFAMAHVQAAYNAENDKRAAEGKADKLDNEVKNLKTENTDLLAKLGRLEKRCEKLRHEKAEIGNKAIQAFLDGTAGEEWLRKRAEDGLSIFYEGFQKAKELTMAKYPSLFLDDIVVPTFESPSGETAAPTEAGDVISPREKSVRSGNAHAS
ncbi:hypothetical protein RJ640_029087 [Escallonia rubra]|uniref:Transposase (putative) gypsy type domain-containing protein n=1 Tax=Escallonia rubra TaxID=112253 RepID=A0AA88RE42_9ASTE|nr:hypothetical protein RJ640_029087 [Escallonia rubra]